MVNDPNYYTLYMANIRRDEMLKTAEMERMKREIRLSGEDRKPKAIVSHILEGAGNALVSTGNRLLAIA